MAGFRRPERRCGWLLTRLLAGAWVVCALSARAPCAEPAPPAYDRADAESVRSTARRILRSEAFIEVRQPRNLLDHWLAEMASWDWSTSTDWAGVVYTILLIVGGAAVAVVLVHVIWRIVTAYRPGRRGVPGDAPIPHFQAMCHKPYDELRAMMVRRRDAGKFGEAIGLMMAALLRWLGDAKVLHVEKSKTNGDYVREYPPGGGGREPFRTFSLDFDMRIYADRTCRDQDYQHMLALFEATRNDVRRQP